MIQYRTNPFMQAVDGFVRYWHSIHLPANGCVYVMQRTDADWTSPFLYLVSRGRYQPKVTGLDVMAHPSTWAALAAHNLAAAYRPEVVP